MQTDLLPPLLPPHLHQHLRQHLDHLDRHQYRKMGLEETTVVDQMTVSRDVATLDLVLETMVLLVIWHAYFFEALVETTTKCL